MRKNKISIREIGKKDYKKAIQFAVEGMNFDLYLKNRFLLNLYGTYFWYDELNHATVALSAYDGEELLGVLLADMEGERRRYGSFRMKIFTAVFEFLQRVFSKEGADVYAETNRELFREYRKKEQPDGQIVFLAADPQKKGMGIGSRLLDELARREQGRNVFLYTDDACTYEFYEKRGFKRSGEKEVVLKFEGRRVPLKCLLYSKVL